MDNDIVELGERRERQQVSNPECVVILPLSGPGDQDQTCPTPKPASVEPCVQTLVNRLDVGATQKTASVTEKCLCVNVEPPTAPDPDGPNPCTGNVILSGESLARESLFNEHFNNPLPQESPYRMSVTEMTDGRDSGAPGPASQGPASSQWLRDDSTFAVDECPICTESYRPKGEHSMVLLNCDHVVCQSCLAALLAHASDRSRVHCPLCRQKTPLIRWEICRLQEAAGFLSRPSDTSSSAEQSSAEPGLVRGLWGRLEEYLLLRAEMARVWGCFEHPRWLVRAIRRTQLCCRCCYISLLLMLYLVELSFLTLIFLPIGVLVLLFTLTGREK